MLRLLGGEIQQDTINHHTGYSEKAKRTGSQAYLEPNSNRMQKPIGGLPVLAFSTTKNKPCHTKAQPIYSLYKGAIDCSKQQPKTNPTKHTTPHAATRNNRKAHSVIKSYQFVFTIVTTKTLIPHDTTLILAKLASKRIQQHRIRHQKTRCNPALAMMRSEG